MGNVGIVQTAYDSFATGDIPAIIELMDASVEWSSPMTLPQGGHFSGTAGAVQFFQGLGASWESLGLTVESLGEVAPGTVVAVVSLSGELRSGGPGSYGAAHVFSLADGKITHFREYTDLDKAIG
jgi:ketosteroid isomerase-like protein